MCASSPTWALWEEVGEYPLVFIRPIFRSLLYYLPISLNRTDYIEHSRLQLGGTVWQKSWLETTRISGSSASASDSAMPLRCQHLSIA